MKTITPDDMLQMAGQAMELSDETIEASSADAKMIGSSIRAAGCSIAYGLMLVAEAIEENNRLTSRRAPCDNIQET